MDLTAPFGRGSVTLAALSRIDLAHRSEAVRASTDHSPLIRVY